MSSSLYDWRQAIKMPPSYRLANSSVRIQTQFVIFVALIGVAVLIIFLTYFPKNNLDIVDHNYWDHIHEKPSSLGSKHSYNKTYPLTLPVETVNGLKYRIAIIADLDTNSKDELKAYTWISYLLKGYLTINIAQRTAKITWDPVPTTLSSTLSQAGRGMELSELIVFNGRLYTVDDRTGIVFEIIDSNKVVPWVMLNDGDGKAAKGFKSEWATVKDQVMYVGGLGKEWTSETGEIVNYNPQWIKKIYPDGHVQSLNWHHVYTKLRQVAGYEYPGYIIHEAVNWSPQNNKWFFLPRRASRESYTEKEDEHKGTNLLITVDDTFSKVKVNKVGPVFPTHGFSSFKFIPGLKEQVIVALKSEEDNGNISSYITVFTLKGEILMPETKIYGNHKYEGIEFI